MIVSDGKTFSYEDQLPRVPLPTLEETCARFLEWCAPLLTDAELASTEAAVEQFLAPDSTARSLHAALEEFDGTEGVRSWLDLFWPTRYLGRRDRIALNANFFFLFRDVEETQEQRAAALISAAVAYKVRLDAEAIPPVVLRGEPQSMVQNKFLFSATRIPHEQQDTARTTFPSDARHVVVFFRGNAFRMDVVGPDGVPHDLGDLTGGLQAIMKADRAEFSAGPLTTKARAAWAHSREALLVDNAAALETIETALFCVALEDFAPADTLAACDQLLHGDSANRWFDKAVTFVVFADGRAGINVEHCELDGTTILAFTDAMLSVPTEEHLRVSGAAAQGLPATEPVEFVLSEELCEDSVAAAASFAQYGADTATVTLSFEDFGKRRAKELKISPDAFVQMAYQLAHQRSKGLQGATYESIGTRQFQNGRTEAMRVVTPEAIAFVSTVEDASSSRADRRAAFRAAADAHVRRAKECQAGSAPEQHLWELQLIHKRRGGTEPLPLYDTPGWTIMRDDYLSTSSAPSEHIQYFGFGSTSAKCIGVAYVLLPDRFNLYLSTPRPVAEEMHRFATYLGEAITELQDLLATED
ncbi:choline/carnitine O-acyltransferase [Lentzea sp. NPDC058450]|uniref:choline/carnitine O-acyltransferase n=1 Tax=Lentzea sp. NPDC058450 TaxID=3346505 RepID=UPI0036658A80